MNTERMSLVKVTNDTGFIVNESSRAEYFWISQLKLLTDEPDLAVHFITMAKWEEKNLARCTVPSEVLQIYYLAAECNAIGYRPNLFTDDGGYILEIDEPRLSEYIERKNKQIEAEESVRGTKRSFWSRLFGKS